MRTNPPGRCAGAREWKTGNETDLGCQGVKKPGSPVMMARVVMTWCKILKLQNLSQVFYHHLLRSILRKGSGVRRDSSIACDRSSKRQATLVK